MRTKTENCGAFLPAILDGAPSELGDLIRHWFTQRDWVEFFTEDLADIRTWAEVDTRSEWDEDVDEVLILSDGLPSWAKADGPWDPEVQAVRHIADFFGFSLTQHGEVLLPVHCDDGDGREWDGCEARRVEAAL